MNAVLVEAPDNCIDILKSALRPAQVETVWRLAKAEPSGAIRKRLSAAPETWIDGLVRALEAVSTFHWEGRTTISYYRGDERLALLVDMASTLKEAALGRQIGPAKERMISSWTYARPRVSLLIDTLRLLRHEPAFSEPEIRQSRMALRSALMRQTGQELTPTKVLDLSDLEPTLSISGEEARALRIVAGGWPRQMGDWLRDCRSERELRALQDVLVDVAERLSVDLRGPLSAVATELSGVR